MEDELDVGRNLYHFYKFIMRPLHNDFTESDHITKLADHLMNLVKGEYNNLCVAMPPRHSKSSMVTLSFPLWLILNDHNLNILILNAEHRLCEKFGIDLREYIELLSSETGLYLSDVKHSNTHLMFEDEHGVLQKGNIQLHSINGNYTGQDADYIIIDDPYKGFEDVTPTLLDKKIDLFKTKVLQRREPHTKLIICHTRWHTNDLQGYLKEHNPHDYKFLEFPAIGDNDIPLWPERFNITFLKKQLEEMGERLFSSIYQQRPLDMSGSFFNTDYLRFEEHTRNNYTYGQTVRSWDLAYSDESKGQVNDSTASCLMTRTLDNYYIIREITNEQYGDNLKQILKSTAYLDTPNIPILLETGTTGGASEFLFQEYKDNYLTGYNVQQSKPIGSKVDRATPFRDAILDGKIIIDLNDEQREELIKQLQSFPLGKHDDIIDACSYAYNYLQLRDYNIIKTGNKRSRFKL